MGNKYECEKCGCDIFIEMPIIANPNVLKINKKTVLESKLKLSCKNCGTFIPFDVSKSQTVTYTFVLNKK